MTSNLLKWTLVFSDEFEGDTLDGAKWVKQFPWGQDSTSTPDLIYRDANVTVSGSQLHLQAKRETVVIGATTYHYTSGMVSTSAYWDLGDGVEDYRFLIRHGRMECRAKCPVGAGLTPAFWLLPPQGVWPPEIDVLEMFNDSRRRVAQHYHYSNGVANIDDGGYSDIPADQSDMTEGFHDYAVEWEPGEIRWYVDDVQYLSTRPDFTSRFVSAVEMYLLLNLQVGLVGDPTNTTLPVQMDIDWVRVYQMSAFGDIVTGLATVLEANITGLKAYDYPVDSVSHFPAAIILQDPMDLEVVIGGNTFTTTLRVVFLLSSGDDAIGFRQLWDYLDPVEVNKSVNKAVETDKTLDGKADNAGVTRIENIGRRELWGANYFGFDALVDVIKTLA